MKIETKFDIGDKVITINRTFTRTEKTCPLCKGEKRFRATADPDFSIDCPTCAGTGMVGEYNGSRWTVAGEDEIEQIHVSNYRNPKFNTIDYTLCKASGTVYERNVFSSVKDAQTECDRRNMEEL